MPRGSRGYRGGGGTTITSNALDILSKALAGMRVRNRLSLTNTDRPASGSAVAQGPLKLSFPSKSGAHITHKAVGAAETNVLGGTEVVTAATSSFQIADALGGVTLGKLRLDLSRNSGAIGVIENPKGGRTDWQNDANAIGPNDGATATFSGNALAARGGELELSYANWTGKDNLVIDSVELHYYVSQAGTVLANGSLICEHQVVGGSRTVDLDPTGNVNHLVAPFIVDLSAEVTVLSDLDGLLVWVGCQTVIGNIHTAQLDAVEIVVTAHHEVSP